MLLTDFFPPLLKQLEKRKLEDELKRVEQQEEKFRRIKASVCEKVAYTNKEETNTASNVFYLSILITLQSVSFLL